MKGRLIGFYNYTVILTYVGVLSAVLGILLASQGRLSFAVVCLLVSGFCDLFDGSIAKTKKDRTQNEKQFGIQIDSLADLVCFGVLPAALGAAAGFTKLWQMLLLGLYVLAALIRLAYYNVTEDELQLKKNTPRQYYEGLPVTTASLLFPLLFAVKPYLGAAFPSVYLAWSLLIASAFVSRIRIKKLGMTGMCVAACLGAVVLVMLIFGWNE